MFKLDTWVSNIKTFQVKQCNLYYIKITFSLNLTTNMTVGSWYAARMLSSIATPILEYFPFQYCNAMFIICEYHSEEREGHSVSVE